MASLGAHAAPGVQPRSPVVTIFSVYTTACRSELAVSNNHDTKKFRIALPGDLTASPPRRGFAMSLRPSMHAPDPLGFISSIGYPLTAGLGSTSGAYRCLDRSLSGGMLFGKRRWKICSGDTFAVPALALKPAKAMEGAVGPCERPGGIQSGLCPRPPILTKTHFPPAGPLKPYNFAPAQVAVPRSRAIQNQELYLTGRVCGVQYPWYRSPHHLVTVHQGAIPGRWKFIGSLLCLVR
ncbi:hypothetical protein P885DRAFT_56810 [Corynascus similis CBS 632.67]